ncbi:MAG: hypothetical protein D6695_02015, partial [Planctomycetota bacterium]
MTRRSRTFKIQSRADLESIPGGYGAVGVFDAAERCVLLASTSDIRGFCAKRFEHITHAGESTTILCQPCASMFEADLCYLHAARELLPQARPSILDQWRCWFLAFDLHQGRWSACSPDDPSPAAKDRTVIGPMRDRHAAS